MTPRDPRQGHPAHDPTDPPPRTLGVPIRRKPEAPAVEPLPDETSASVERPAPWYSHWSPTTIASAVVIVVAALGGTTGLAEIFGASKKLDDLNAKLDALAAQERTERAKQQRKVTMHAERIDYLAELAARMNGRAPHPTFPAPREGQFRLPVEPTAFVATGLQTDKPWPQDAADKE
jgi:hypothetical protein